MTTPQPLDVSELKHWLPAEKEMIWLAAQWLKKQIAEEAQLSPEKIIWVNGYVEQAFGACRPDAEKKQ